MAATLDTAPASPAYNGNDLFITIASDLQTAAAGYIDLIFSSTGPSIGQTFEVTWGGNNITFTVAATTNITATAIPTKGAESLNEYAIRVGEAFRENNLINEHWIITAHTGGRVRLTNKIVGLLDIIATEDMANTAMTVEDGVDNTVANLAAHIEVWKAGDTFSADERLAVLHSPYKSSTANTGFNLKDLFPVSPALPAEISITSSLSLSWKHGVATTASMLYYLRIADKYGSPAVPDALVRSIDNYVALHGARPEDHDDVISSSLINPLHGYRTTSGTFRKPIVDMQPDWFYLFTAFALTGVRLEFEITWDDGTVTTETPSNTVGNLAANKAHWIRSTPYNLNFAPPTDGAMPWLITFRLFGNAGEGEITLAEVYYVVRPCTEWDVFLLMDNGLGGCESVLFRGKNIFGMDATRDVARRARSSSFTPKDGEIINFNAEGQKSLELSTGWHDLYYIQHLRQLIMGDLWLIDMEQKRFLKLIIESSSVTTHEDDVELYAFNIKVKTAWIDRAQNP